MAKVIGNKGNLVPIELSAAPFPILLKRLAGELWALNVLKIPFFHPIWVKR